MKVLHLTYHRGCSEEIRYVSEVLGFELETVYANWNYNIGAIRADRLWGRLMDKIQGVDIVLTTDTAPLSRIPLQHKKDLNPKVLVWVCNRIDYWDQSTNDCNFPDPAYYRLLNESSKEGICKIIGYTDYEIPYALKKGVSIDPLVIKPTGRGFLSKPLGVECLEPEHKKGLVFVPPYHNDTLFMNLVEQCKSVGIDAFCGRYNGPKDLQGFKGIVHIPYAWSTFTFFEMMVLGIPYFVPSPTFIEKLARTSNFWWQNFEDFHKKGLSEWYHQDHLEIVTYFDSWEDLSKLLKVTNVKALSKQIQDYSEKHAIKQLGYWEKVLEELTSD